MFDHGLLLNHNLAALWPVHLEVSESHSHYIDNRRDLGITFKGLLGKTVLDRQQTKVSHNDIVGRGGLGQEDDGCIEVDIETDSTAALCQLLHTWCCFLCCLDCYLSQGLFGLLEVVNECLGEKKKGKQQSMRENDRSWCWSPNFIINLHRKGKYILSKY